MRGDGSRFIREHPVILILLVAVPVCLAAGLATGISGLLGGKEGLPGYISSYDVSSGESPGCYCVEGISAEGEGVGFCEPGRGQYDGRLCVRTRGEPL